MSVSSIIIYILVAFMAWGVIDLVFFNNRFGYGEKFEEGINAMGPLALAMIGIMCLAPVIGNLLTPVVEPLFRLVGADPAMFAGSILAIDMGGFPLAQAMTENQDVIVLSGVLLSSMLGATIVFSIPVSLGIVQEKDRPFLAKGMLIGVISIPFGTFIGALVAGIPVGLTLINLIPSTLLSILLALGLWLIPEKLLKGFSVFSKLITSVITLALACAIIEQMTGLVVIPGMDPILPQFEVVGTVAIALAGAYPMVHFITSKFSKALAKLGGLLQVNEVSIAGIIAALANPIPTYGMLKDMDNRGKVIAIAFSVPALTVMGDQLGYVSANAQAYLLPMVVAKLSGGLIAVLIATLFLKEVTDEEPESIKNNTPQRPKVALGTQIAEAGETNTK